MPDRQSAAPPTFFFLMLPYGISQGYIAVTLPFVLTKAGVPVATTAGIVAIGLSANVWRFLWGPIADLTLSLRRWYVIGLIAAAVSLVLLGFMPPRPGALLTSLVFTSQVAATFTLIPLGGMMAHTVAEGKKGRASGWYQAGGFAGAGIGGGAGVWLAAHYSDEIAAPSLATAMLIAIGALRLVPDVRAVSNERLASRLRDLGRDFANLLKSPTALLVVAMVVSPIGLGAASNLWSSVAGDWHASPDRVALVTGLLSGVFSAVGCVAGGALCDRLGRWWAFFSGGAVVAVVAVVMAAAPRTPDFYSSGVLTYAFGTGAANAAYSALVLFATGRGAASTKYAILSSIGNVPSVYMTAFDGWAHDRWSVAGMLNAEALLGILCIAIGLTALGKINRAVSRVTGEPSAGAVGAD
jgi:MFS transporter, PAT family, beta-lactamase induction signal transducer AmpG